MSRFTTAAKVGLFTVVLAVAGVLIYRFVSKKAGTSSGYAVYALFKDASGIAKHSQVRVAGIPVGHIEDIKLVAGMARIDVRIRPDVALYEDAAIGKVSSSFLGEFFLSISQGTDGRRKLVDGDQIKVVIEASTTDDILRDVSDIAKKVKKIADSLASSVGTEQGEQNIRETLKNLADVTDALNKTVRENRETIRNILINVEGITTRGKPEVDKILENIRVTTEEVRSLVAEAKGGTAAPGEVRQIIEKVNRASSSLERTLQNFDTISGRIERGEGTLGRLTKDDKLIDEVEGVARGVNEFVGGLQRLQTIVALRTDYQFLNGGVKTYVELRLQPREDKYYMIEVVNDPRGVTRIEQVDVDSTNPNEPPHARELRYVTTNSFAFSVQFAQTFGPFTGRFGVKESTGGVGLDLSLFENRFEVRQDLFGFGVIKDPRYRISLGYEFVDRLWLLAGLDDVLRSNERDYFLGLQLKFNDEDLKSILPFAPSP